MNPDIQNIEDPLQHYTATRTLVLVKRKERRAGRGLEHVVNTLSREAGALEVAAGGDLAGDVLAVLGGNEAEGLLALLLDGDGILAEILLETDEDDRDAWAEAGGLCYPLWSVSPRSILPLSGQ